MTIDTSIDMTSFEKMANDYFGGEENYPVDNNLRRVNPYLSRKHKKLFMYDMKKANKILLNPELDDETKIEKINEKSRIIMVNKDIFPSHKNKKTLSDRRAQGGIRALNRKEQEMEPATSLDILGDMIDNYDPNCGISLEELNELYENGINVQVELVNLDEIEAE